MVTDPDCNAMWDRSNADAVKAAVEGGATIVQIREKDANGGAMLRQVGFSLTDLLNCNTFN